jgi:hypothetical protein
MWTGELKAVDSQTEGPQAVELHVKKRQPQTREPQPVEP